ncbi:MAG: cysteine--tRNA ligase [Holosporales bacterium]|jgi:cysteinyl-tRNA synthetase|nr:cysteine--tRNA ligase [Holosporales bacterium]
MNLKLKLHNTLSGKSEIFQPIDENNVKMYVCGPTVYDRPHIGNARSVVVFDVLYRILKFLYKDVTYVRNITDIDDKIYKAALEKNIEVLDLTDKTIKMHHDDMEEMNVLPVAISPRATEHIKDIVNFVEQLIKSGNAYVTKGHVYFDVSSFKNYGHLSKKNTDDLISGARIEISELKKNPLDFVLWKPIDENFNLGWDSPWGLGRPGWHIECSAMSQKYLGDLFDIHGGGIDLVFPHHENEIAQSCSFSHQEKLANYWIHNGHLTINGTKMSKSAKNFFTVNELLKKYDGEVIRFMFLMTHYSAPINFSFDTLDQAKNILNRWYNALLNTEPEETDEICQDAFDALLDNMNTSKAISILSLKVGEINKLGNRELAGKFANTCRVLLGLMHRSPSSWFCGEISNQKAWVESRIEARSIAKKTKNYDKADSIRAELLSHGIVLEDHENGTKWKLQN